MLETIKNCFRVFFINKDQSEKSVPLIKERPKALKSSPSRLRLWLRPGKRALKSVLSGLEAFKNSLKRSAHQTKCSSSRALGFSLYLFLFSSLTAIEYRPGPVFTKPIKTEARLKEYNINVL